MGRIRVDCPRYTVRLRHTSAEQARSVGDELIAQVPKTQGECDAAAADDKCFIKLFKAYAFQTGTMTRSDGMPLMTDVATGATTVAAKAASLAPNQCQVAAHRRTSPPLLGPPQSQPKRRPRTEPIVIDRRVSLDGRRHG